MKDRTFKNINHEKEINGFENISYEEKAIDDFIVIDEKSENINYEKELKKYTIVLLGDEYINKRYIIRCYKEGKIIKSINNSSLIGFERLEKNIRINSDEILLSLINVSSQERSKVIHKIIYKNGDGFLIFFSYEDEESFISIKLWYDKIIEYKKNINNCPIFIVGLHYSNSLKNLKNISREKFEEQLKSKKFEFKNCDESKFENINSVFNDLINLIYKLNKN